MRGREGRREEKVLMIRAAFTISFDVRSDDDPLLVSTLFFLLLLLPQKDVHCALFSSSCRFCRAKHLLLRSPSPVLLVLPFFSSAPACFFFSRSPCPLMPDSRDTRLNCMFARIFSIQFYEKLSNKPLGYDYEKNEFLFPFPSALPLLLSCLPSNSCFFPSLPLKFWKPELGFPLCLQANQCQRLPHAVRDAA